MILPQHTHMTSQHQLNSALFGMQVFWHSGTGFTDGLRTILSRFLR